MTVAISKALESGAQAVICASTGNTAASAAAYAARAGLVAVVLQPEGAVASGKLAQARALGARVLEVRGSFDEALSAARALADRGTHVLVNSLNPDRLEGQKTAAFEIGEELGAAPDVLALPYGGGGNLTAYARGFAETGERPPPGRGRGGGAADDRCLGDPDRDSGPRRDGRRGTRSVRRRRRLPHGRSDPPSLARARPRGGRLLRALLRRRPRCARGSRPRARIDRRLRRHGARAQGSRVRLAPQPGAGRSRSRPGRDRGRLAMSAVRVRAPASSANLGPGFDCAAVALELWNELEVTDGRRRPRPRPPRRAGVRTPRARRRAVASRSSTASRASAASARARP